MKREKGLAKTERKAEKKKRKVESVAEADTEAVSSGGQAGTSGAPTDAPPARKQKPDAALNEEDVSRAERDEQRRAKHDAKLRKPDGCLALSLYRIRPKMISEAAVRGVLAACGEVAELQLTRGAQHAFGLVRFATTDAVDRAKALEGTYHALPAPDGAGKAGFRITRMDFCAAGQVEQRKQKIAEAAARK